MSPLDAAVTAAASRSLHSPRRSLLGVLILTAAAVSGCTTTSLETQRLDELFSEIPDDVPGCAGAVHFDDDVVWTGVRGFADVEDQLLITEDTVFGIGPLTQQFTATAVLLLAQAGDLDLDDPIREFLPTLPEWADTVTVEHLLQRTSGIPDYEHGDLLTQAENAQATAGDILRTVGDVEQLEFDPGTRFEDSWTENVLQALIVEEVDGRPLAEFLAEEVFPAAGIEAVMDGTPEIPGLAASYASGGSSVPVPERQREAVGDRGIFTTASDLARWGSQYWEPSVGGEELLAQRTAIMIAGEFLGPVTDLGPPRPGDGLGTRYGGGLFAGYESADAELIITGPPGEDAGFVGGLAVAPEARISAAVLCNHGRHDYYGISRDLLDAFRSANG